MKSAAAHSDRSNTSLSLQLDWCINTLNRDDNESVMKEMPPVQQHPLKRCNSKTQELKQQTDYRQYQRNIWKPISSSSGHQSPKQNVAVVRPNDRRSLSHGNGNEPMRIRNHLEYAQARSLANMSEQSSSQSASPRPTSPPSAAGATASASTSFEDTRIQSRPGTTCNSTLEIIETTPPTLKTGISTQRKENAYLQNYPLQTETCYSHNVAAPFKNEESPPPPLPNTSPPVKRLGHQPAEEMNISYSTTSIPYHEKRRSDPPPASRRPTPDQSRNANLLRQLSRSDRFYPTTNSVHQRTSLQQQQYAAATPTSSPGAVTTYYQHVVSSSRPTTGLYDDVATPTLKHSRTASQLSVSGDYESRISHRQQASLDGSNVKPMINDGGFIWNSGTKNLLDETKIKTKNVKLKRTASEQIRPASRQQKGGQSRHSSGTSPPFRPHSRQCISSATVNTASAPVNFSDKQQRQHCIEQAALFRNKKLELNTNRLESHHSVPFDKTCFINNGHPRNKSMDDFYGDKDASFTESNTKLSFQNRVSSYQVLKEAELMFPANEDANSFEVKSLSKSMDAIVACTSPSVQISYSEVLPHKMNASFDGYAYMSYAGSSVNLQPNTTPTANTDRYQMMDSSYETSPPPPATSSSTRPTPTTSKSSPNQTYSSHEHLHTPATPIRKISSSSVDRLSGQLSLSSERLSCTPLSPIIPDIFPVPVSPDVPPTLPPRQSRHRPSNINVQPAPPTSKAELNKQFNPAPPLPTSAQPSVSSWEYHDDLNSPQDGMYAEQLRQQSKILNIAAAKTRQGTSMPTTRAPSIPQHVSNESPLITSSISSIVSPLSCYVFPEGNSPTYETPCVSNPSYFANTAVTYSGQYRSPNVQSTASLPTPPPPPTTSAGFCYKSTDQDLYTRPTCNTPQQPAHSASKPCSPASATPPSSSLSAAAEDSSSSSISGITYTVTTQRDAFKRLSAEHYKRTSSTDLSIKDHSSQISETLTTEIQIEEEVTSSDKDTPPLPSRNCTPTPIPAHLSPRVHASSALHHISPPSNQIFPPPIPIIQPLPHSLPPQRSPPSLPPSLPPPPPLDDTDDCIDSVTSVIEEVSKETSLEVLPTKQEVLPAKQEVQPVKPEVQSDVPVYHIESSSHENSKAIRFDPADQNNSIPVQIVEPSPAIPFVAEICHRREKSLEEHVYDRQAAILASQLSERERSLCDLILPSPDNKITSDYMKGIFDNGSETFIEDISVVDNSDDWRKPQTQNSINSVIDVNVTPITISDSKQIISGDNSKPLIDQKNELIVKIKAKIVILESELNSLNDDVLDNEKLGELVKNCVRANVKTKLDFDRYEIYVEELGKVVRLLLHLSSKLADSQNALNECSDSMERINLEKKCDLHKKKHDDACELKAVSDNRRKQVTTSLAMFSTEDMNDYECYTTAKPRLAMFVREVEDRIRLSRHQLDALLESMQQP